jgi:hypothetical protein
MPHALGIGVNDTGDSRQAVAERQQSIDLLLALNRDEACPGVVENLAKVFVRGVAIERRGDSTGSLGGDHGPIKPRAIVAENEQRITARKAEAA